MLRLRRRHFFVIIIVTVTRVTWVDAMYMGTVLDKFENGPDGVCKMSKSTLAKDSITCPSPFVPQAQKRGEETTTLRGCSYFNVTYSYHCIVNEQVTCIRSRLAYYGTQICYNTWLAWGPCSTSCGHGIKTRFKYKQQNMFDTQMRGCTVAPCPAWSDWAPVTIEDKPVECDVETCQRQFTRMCQQNGSAVSVDQCGEGNKTTKFQLPGYKYVNSSYQTRPCAPTECIRPTTPMPITQASTLTTVNVSAVGANEKSHDGANPFNSNGASNTAWQAIAIVAILAVLLLIAILFIGTRTKYKRFLKKGKPAPRLNLQSSEHARNGWFVSRTESPLHSSPIIQANSSQNTADYLTPRNLTNPTRAKTLPVIPPSLPNGTVPKDTHVPDESQLPIYDEARGGEINADNRNSGVVCVDENNTSQSVDPIYSDIPAYATPNIVKNENSPKKTVGYFRHSSDFDTTSSCDTEDFLPTIRSRRSQDIDDESFSSDEDRDIVRTLNRKHGYENGRPMHNKKNYDNLMRSFNKPRKHRSYRDHDLYRYPSPRRNCRTRENIDEHELSRGNFRKISGKHSPIFIPRTSSTPAYEERKLQHSPHGAYDQNEDVRKLPRRQTMSNAPTSESFSRTSDYHSTRDSGSEQSSSLEQYYQQRYRRYEDDDHQDDYDDYPEPAKRYMKRSITERRSTRAREMVSKPHYEGNRAGNRWKESRRETTQLRSKTGKVITVDESCYARPTDTKREDLEGAYSTYTVPYSPRSNNKE